MSDKAKRIVQRLDAIRGALMTRGGIMVTDAIGFLGEAANLIEELSAELEAAKEREKGLSIMLTSAQSDADRFKRERDELLGKWEGEC